MKARSVAAHPTRRIVTGVLAAALAAVIATGCSASAADEPTSGAHGDPSGDATVILAAVSFAPADLVVGAGTTVNWTWEGGVVHDVSGGVFNSLVQSEGDFEHTFHEVGVYPYRCSLHGAMGGTVTVVAP